MLGTVCQARFVRDEEEARNAYQVSYGIVQSRTVQNRSFRTYQTGSNEARDSDVENGVPVTLCQG